MTLCTSDECLTGEFVCGIFSLVDRCNTHGNARSERDHSQNTEVGGKLARQPSDIGMTLLGAARDSKKDAIEFRDSKGDLKGTGDGLR